MSDLERVLNRIDADEEESLERLFALLRIPSISTDPAYASACNNAAQWCAEHLKSIGFDAAVRTSPGRPFVVGHHRKGGRPHVLFYGHYDVQPVDPVDEWESDPFQPEIVEQDGRRRIRARGAADDKGQLMTFVEAARAWMEETGDLPVDVTVFLEGEEESSSPSMEPFLTDNAEELRADVALVCDTNMWDAATPAITSSLRGLCFDEVRIKAASRDLHSGLYGNTARNPIHVLCRILGQLHDDNGRVTLPGFYDGVAPVSDDLKARWAALDFDEKAFLGDVGLFYPAGEKTYSVLEQIWARPSAEVNGIHGGYTGEGAKTVIPAIASAKVSFRLVGDQDPEAVRAAFRAFVRDRLPPDCEASFVAHGGERAISIPTDSPWIGKSLDALSEEWGTPAALIGMGGSIPVVTQFRRILGLDSMMAGFGLPEDRIHSPNETYDTTSYRKGTRSWARILHALAQ